LTVSIDIVSATSPSSNRHQQILPGVERALEQVAVLDDTALPVDQLALRFVQRDRAERGRQVVERAVGGDLALCRVDRHLRADRHRRPVR